MPVAFRSLAAAPLAAVAVLITCIGATPADASVIYRYTGNAFTTVTLTETGAKPAETYAPDDRVTVVLELAAPLAPNLFFATIVPTMFRVTDGIGRITNANATSSTFGVWTNGAGAITAWSIDVARDDYRPGGIARTISTTNYSFFPFSSVEDSGAEALCGPESRPSGCSLFPGPSYVLQARVSGAPGTWSQVPEPSSMLLVGMALAGLAARRRVR